LIETLVQFRSAVRTAALQSLRGDTESSLDKVKELLRLSDDMRDEILPEIGLQLVDNGDKEGRDGWQLCLPRKTEKNESKEELKTAPSDIFSIPLSDFFKVGQYEGVFSKYTEEGIPTHNADGSEVSKRLLKKLVKKREAHRQRLEKTDDA